MKTEPKIHRMLAPLAALALLATAAAAPPAPGESTNPERLEDRVARTACDKKLVLLGELPSHGEAGAFAAKAAIVTRLVERCGFGAVLFEAPIYEFLGFQQAADGDRAERSGLDRAIGRFWTTTGLNEWRRWLFDQAKEGRLLVGGIDDQISATSDHARANLPGLVAGAVPRAKAEECSRAVERNLFWRYDETHPFDGAERNRLRDCARQAADALAGRTGSGADLRALAMAENLAGLYARQAKDPGAPERDAAMSRNVGWYLENLPEGAKVVVWTSTVHAARKRGARPYVPLGARLADEHGEELAAIGFTAFAGESSMAGMAKKALPEMPPGSLEARAIERGEDRIYLDAATLEGLGEVPSRLFGDSIRADWSSFFDGVVVIREETAPVFDPR